MGVRPPFFTLAAVRAMAPVAGMPPNRADAILPAPCGHELHVAAVVGADHRIRHDAGKQGLDCRQDGNGDAVGQLFAEQIYAEHGDVEFRDAGVDGVEVADGADVHVEAVDQDDSRHKGDKRAGDALG